MEFVAKEWFERRSRNENNDIDAMIHTLDCRHARPNNPSWRRFTSVAAALAQYELARVCKVCLSDQGPHLDRRR